MPEHVEILIIGAGPAGLSAGIYGGRAGRRTLLLEKGKSGGRAALTERVVNYPGFPEISGSALTQQMREQALSLGAEIRRETVKRIALGEEGEKHVFTRRGEYIADTVIAATGTSPRTLGIPGEAELTGRGVAYCAACDAAFFEGCTVAVIGSGDQAIEESELIARYASRVEILVIHEEGQLDCNPLAAQTAFANPKLHFHWNVTPTAILGTDSVTGVTLRNVKTNAIEELPCDGVFLFVGMQPNTGWLSSVMELPGWIPANERMETGLPGIFAAGDVREKPLRQIASAVSDGAVAAVMADAYLKQMAQYEVLMQRSETQQLHLLFWSSSYSGGFPSGASDSVLIDVDKNSYLAEKFGATKHWFQDGHLQVILQNRQIQFVASPASGGGII